MKVDNEIIQESTRLSQVYKRYKEVGLIREIQYLSKTPNPNLYILRDSNNKFIAGNFSDTDSLWNLKRLDEGGVLFSFEKKNNSGEITRKYYFRGKEFIVRNKYNLIVARDVSYENYLKDRFFNTILSTSLLIIFLGLLGGYVLSRNFLNRISAINKTSLEIMDGDLSMRLPTSSNNDELNQLSLNLNNMLDRLNKLMIGMKDVSDNIAHDLRTPLNKIRTNLEVTLMSNPDSESYRESIKEVIEDIDGVINTFNSLLAISRVDSGSVSLKKEKINIKDLIENIADLWGPLAEEKGVVLNNECENDIYFNGNKNLLSQAISNLIDNSIKYGKKNNTINLGSSLSKENIIIWVSDTGPGIKDEDKEKVLDRFTRLDTSRNTSGTGLGLSLVNSMIKFHKGKIELIDAKPRGLIVKLQIPTH
jgi:signal transduction histidine kinase